MISVADLDQISEARLEDAKMLLASSRFDAAAYMCGYAVEVALKARICRTLGWLEFPMSQREFQGLASFRTHDLGILLYLSGRDAMIKQGDLGDWTTVAVWNPDDRYRPIGSTAQADAESIINAVDALLKVI